MDILDEIVERRRRDISRLKRLIPKERLAEQSKKREVRDFQAALTRSRISVIAETKKASPSAGLLRA